MMGFPGEDLKTALETVEINRKVNPWYASCTVFQPLPGTEIYRYCIDNGYLNPDFGVDDISYQRMGKSVLKQKDIKLLR